ncbi:MAG TPA: 3-oxoacyl-ACP reductase family protein [Chloroflexota bacterium]|nr:3-oxoacyl-ACP reductase family protein [Chloroflexota bacterium]
MALTIDLSGKVAIVTGAGTGIGVGIAESLAEAGADVALVYHASREGAERLAEKVRQMGRRAITIAADLQRLADIDRLVATTVAELGPVDILINNSGITDPHPPLELTEEQWDRTLDINLKGMFFCSQRVARVMIEHQIRGAMVNLSSVHSTAPYLNHTHYAASKAAINQMTRSLARHLAPYGIRVNCIAPGAVEVERYFRTMPDYNRDEWAKRIPLGRVGSPADIGPAAAFLCSEYASWMTGQVIFIDGGGLLM